MLTAGLAESPPDALGRVLDTPVLLLPSVEPGSGPFPGRKAAWLPETPTPDLIPAAASLYLAVMTATSLELTGAKGPVIVEGPFARNRAYLDMLTVATGRPVHASAASSTGTSIGAALLALGPKSGLPSGAAATPPPDAAAAKKLANWRRRWLDAVHGGSR